MAGIKEEKKIYLVGIYCRLSKDDGTDNESASIATQKSILTDYVKKQGWHIAKTYVDDGYSGTNFQRPSFQKVVDVVLVGSRSRGIEHEESDVNVVVEFYGSEREDALSDILNEEGLSIAGKTIDINTITKDRTGTLETFLPEEEKYLAEKAAAMEQTAASKNMVADMSIEQAAEAELKSSDEKKRQHPDQKRGGKFANFSMQKKENSEKYNLYADVQYPSGEIDRHKCIAQFDNKSLAQRFCEKRGLQCEDVTGNLDSVIKHKKQLANQKGKISPDRNERKPGRGIGD